MNYVIVHNAAIAGTNPNGGGTASPIILLNEELVNDIPRLF